MTDSDKPDEAAGLPIPVSQALVTEPADRILVFQMEIPIRWGDMDAQRHVNNVTYFRYMEQARISWFTALGIEPVSLNAGPIIVNAFCSFNEQLEYPGTVQARLSVGRFGRSTVETFVDMSRSDAPDTVVATGGAKVVWVDHTVRKSMPLPDAMRRRMSQPVGLLAGD